MWHLENAGQTHPSLTSFLFSFFARPLGSPIMEDRPCGDACPIPVHLLARAG